MRSIAQKIIALNIVVVAGTKVCSYLSIILIFFSLLQAKKTQNIRDIFNETFWSHSETESEHNSAASLPAALGVRNNFAKHPLLAVPDNRKSTFLTYPHSYMSHVDVDLLADAGYFYQGIKRSNAVHVHTYFFAGSTRKAELAGPTK